MQLIWSTADGTVLSCREVRMVRLSIVSQWLVRWK